MNKKSCKCGHWYNESVKCPDCDTVASDKYNDIDKIRKEGLQEMIDGRYRNVRRLNLEIKDLEKELSQIHNDKKEMNKNDR